MGGRISTMPIGKGDTFGQVTVTSEPFFVANKHGVNKSFVNTLCGACGKSSRMGCMNIRQKPPVSCGCLSRKRFVDSLLKHGASHSLLYGVWSGMKNRCSQKTSKGYENYGGRGISVCDEWQSDFIPFQQWALANGYAEGLEIDRKDNDGNYEPSNCHWVEPVVNQKNRRITRWGTAFGETKTITDWSQDPRCKVIRRTFEARLEYGWTVEKALTTDVMFIRKKRVKAK